MYQLSFRHALILSTVAHSIVGAACCAGGVLGSIHDAATTEPCDGNHIPHIAASIISDLSSPSPKDASDSENGSKSESSIQITPPAPSGPSLGELPERKKSKPHTHPLSVVKKRESKEESTQASSQQRTNSTTDSEQANSPSGSPQVSPSLGAQNGRSINASPAYFNNPAPPYPEAARRMRREGVVTLLVTVETDGLASSISIRSSSGHQTLDDAAIKAVQSWKFKPGEINGVAVQSKVEVPIRFSLQ